MKKQIKKNIKKHQVEEIIEHEHEVELKDEWKKLAYILGTVVSVIVLVYAFTYFFVTKESDAASDPVSDDVQADVVYQENVILAGESFSKGEDSYYVYFQMSGDTDSLNYGNALFSVEDYLDGKVYYVDLEDGLNNGYYDPEQEAKVDPVSIEELVITSLPTLLHFEGGELKEYLVDQEAMDFIDSIEE